MKPLLDILKPMSKDWPIWGKEIEFFDIDDAATHFYTGLSEIKYYKDDRENSFIRIPPFERTWCEYSLRDIGAEHLLSSAGVKIKIGVLSIRKPIIVDGFSTYSNYYKQFENISEGLGEIRGPDAFAMAKMAMIKGNEEEQFDISGYKWVVFHKFYMLRRNDILNMGFVFDFISPDGRRYHKKARKISGIETLTKVDFKGRIKKEDLIPVEHVNEMKILQLHAVNFAFTLMNTKSKKLVPRPIPEALAKSFVKKHGVPKTVFKVLEIVAPNNKNQYQSSSNTVNKNVMPWHLCRGHFRTYGSDGRGLLFGKYAGTYYITDHVRGNDEAGKVIKDYKVKLDKEKVVV